MRFAALSFAALLSATATEGKAGACLSPVANGILSDDAKRGNASLLVSETLTYPGYPWLVILPGYSWLPLDPSSDLPLFTVRDGRYEPLDVAWPRATWWQFRDYAIRPDGTVIGFGHFPERVYRLAFGDAEFHPVDLPEHVQAGYDAHRDLIVFKDEYGDLFDWDGDRTTLSPLSGYADHPASTFPRYIPGLDIWLASDGDGLVVRSGAEGSEWRTLPGEVGGRWYHSIATAPYHIDRDEALFSVILGGTLLVYRIGPEGNLTLLYTHTGRLTVLFTDGARALLSEKHPLVRRGVLRRWLGQEDVPAWDEPLIVTAEGLRSVADLPVAETPAEGAYRMGWNGAPSSYRSALVHHPPVFDLPGGRYFYDGTHRVRVPGFDEAALGQFVRWFQWRGEVWALTKAGWHALMPDLSLRAIASPFEQLDSVYAVEVAESALFGGLVFISDDGVWLSRDGETFDRLLAGGGTARRYLSDIPGTRTGLVRGEDGLYLLTTDCEGE